MSEGVATIKPPDQLVQTLGQFRESDRKKFKEFCRRFCYNAKAGTLKNKASAKKLIQAFGPQPPTLQQLLSGNFLLQTDASGEMLAARSPFALTGGRGCARGQQSVLRGGAAVDLGDNTLLLSPTLNIHNKPTPELNKISMTPECLQVALNKAQMHVCQAGKRPDLVLRGITQQCQGGGSSCESRCGGATSWYSTCRAFHSRIWCPSAGDPDVTFQDTLPARRI